MKYFFSIAEVYNESVTMSTALEYEYRQISCQRAVNDVNFPRGVQDFNFSVGGNKGWVPNRSYFRIDLSLRGRGGADAPTISDQVALADNVCANLYNNVYVRMGGQDASSIVNYVPQASQVKARLDKSGAWLKTIGADAFGCDADFQSRVNRTTPSIPTQIDGQPQTVKLGTPDNQHDYTIAISAIGEVAGVNTLLNTGTSALVLGDQIIVEGVTYTVQAAATDNAGTGCIVKPFPVAAIVATHNAYKITRANNGDGANNVYLMWQPPVGIMDHATPLGAGDYRIQLNPNANFKQAAVQMLQDSMSAPANFDLLVNDVQFFAAMVTTQIPSTGTEVLHLMEMQVQSKPLSGGANNNLLDFTLPPSTKAITLFVQSGDGGSNTLIPSTLFKTKDQSDENMQSVQIQYANQSKPATRHTSQLVAGTNFMKQRYLDTQLYSGKMWSEGGSEDFGDWLKRGPLYHWSWVRDANDRSTNCQINVQFGNIEPGANLFVCSHYTRAVSIQTEAGFVVSVESLST